MATEVNKNCFGRLFFRSIIDNKCIICSFGFIGVSLFLGEDRVGRSGTSLMEIWGG